jgi:hypothetical protein
MPQLAINVARGETSKRKGRNSFVDYTFEEWSRVCGKDEAQYSTWYAYEAGPLYEYVSANGWSLKGYHATKPALYFDFIPFDFDSDNGIFDSFSWAKTFVNYLLGLGITPDRFSIWLSGSKGFHIEVSRAVFKCQNPSSDILRRLKAFVSRLMKQLNIKIDDSLYSGGQPYRIPYSRHKKTGLHKTRIALENFNLEYLETKEVWAGRPGIDYNVWDNSKPLNLIDLPLLEMESENLAFSPETVIDTSLTIIGKCPRIKGLMRAPEGRELRRQAAAVLMEAYGSSTAPEVEALYEAWEANPHMTPERLADVQKWRGEFEKEGVIKCNKTCSAFGCERGQKRICGTQTPSDHLIADKVLKPVPVAEGREIMRAAIEASLAEPGTPVIVNDFPIGLGKTTTYIDRLSRDSSLTAFYAVPTHALGVEVYEKMKESGIDSIIRIKSRGYLIKQGELICVYPNEVLTSDEISKGTTKKVCMKCPRFPANTSESGETPCEYFQQYGPELKTTRVVIGTHQHINKFVLDKIGMRDRSFLVIDESPLKAFATEVRAVPGDLLAVMQVHYQETLKLLQLDMAAGISALEPGAEVQGGMFGHIMALTAMQEAEKLRELEESDYQVMERERARAMMVYTMIGLVCQGVNLGPQHLESLEEIKYHHYYNRFFNKLAEVSGYEPTIHLEPSMRHVAFPDILANAMECGKVSIPYDVTKTYFFPRLMPHCKTIILDATSSKPLYEKMIQVCNIDPRELIYKTVPLVEQTHAEVIQVTDSGFSKARISSSEDMLEKLMFIPQSLAQTFSEDKILCVSTMDMKTQVGAGMPDRRTNTEHFGDMRGKDKYRHYPLEIIIGGFFVSNQAIVEGLQRLGIHTVDSELLDANTITVRHKHTALDGSTYFSKRKGFKSARRGDAFYYANLIMEQSSVSEIVQAIRVRFFSGEMEKRVYILTNIGLSRMYANRFLRLDELTSELEDLSGMKSDLDTTKVRRDNLMLIRLKRQEIGKEFELAAIEEDPKISRKFLAVYQKSGTVEKVHGKPGVFIRTGNPEEIQEARTPKDQVFSRLDSWFETLSFGTDFTAAEISDEAETTSVRYISAWLEVQTKEHRILILGEKKGRRYRKTQMFTETFSRISL